MYIDFFLEKILNDTFHFYEIKSMTITNTKGIYEQTNESSRIQWHAPIMKDKKAKTKANEQISAMVINNMGPF